MELPLENFYKHKGSKYGRRAICKECYHIRYGEKIKKGSRNRKYFLQLSPNPFEKEHKEKALKDYKNQCVLLGSTENIEIDHFVPLSWSKIAIKYCIGGNLYKNMLPLSRYLNQSKSSRNPFYWIKFASNKYKINMEKWEEAVEYIAEKHEMATIDFKLAVNNCYVEVKIKRKIKYLNSKLIGLRNINHLNLRSFLEQGINLKVAIDVYGSKNAKEFFSKGETEKYIRNLKNLMSKELN
ncbi:HNH endonuclease domain-containing protein [Cytobacillus oceanisediminis]|uniref:HNH endonuclease domain-containing protein n=1 Tax=Cytobacillus oceanisediminis TaxID=665099 RepID=UPI0011A4EF0C|nr:HNH endonuclease domain-containing protein [Cytobacillus oceanisediminis]